MINFSTGLRNNLVNSSGLGSLMNSCAIYVYSGTILGQSNDSIQHGAS